MTNNPIDQEKLRRAREWAKESSTHGYPTSHEYRAAVDLILSLPEPAPLTMADIQWDDALHHLAEAETHSGRVVVMLNPDYNDDRDLISITCSRSGDRYQYLPDHLTPTGNRHRLVPAEWEGGPVPDRQPGTTEPVEDRPEPQPGEAWLVAYSHVPNETFNVIFDHGGHSYDSQGSVWGLDEVTPLHRLAPVMELKVLRTVDDFTAATPSTAVLIDDTVLTKRLLDGRWSDAYCYVREDQRLAEVGPATVIHTPGEQA